MSTHRILFIILGVAALAVISVQAGAYLVNMTDSDARLGSHEPCDRSTASAKQSTICANLLVNYGNGTLQWYNQTVPTGWNAYQLTVYALNGNVLAQFYGPPLNEHLVTALNGLTEKGSLSWNLWTFCSNQNAWSYSQVGADEIHLSSGESLAWVFETSSSTGLPEPPIVGSNTTAVCS